MKTGQVEHPETGDDAGEPDADDDLGDPPDDGDDEVDGSTDIDAGAACGQCPLHAECVDDACECLPGFFDHAGTCVDQNECDDGSGTNPCGDFGSCENTVGSYACTCDDGFALVEGEAPTCVNIDDCAPDPHVCGAGSCIDTAPSYFCDCPPGYEGTNTHACSDVNECDTNNGGCGVATCDNEVGTFVCGDCPPGFVGGGGQPCRWNDARLEALLVSEAPLTPAFETGTTTYLAQAGASTASVMFTPTLPFDGIGRATITVNGAAVASGDSTSARTLAPGDNSFDVKVVAESGASRSYAAFVRRGWTQGAYVKAPNAGYDDAFGYAVAVSSDGLTLAVGAWQEDSAARGVDGDQSDESASNAGAVYVFHREAGGWLPEAYLKASNAEAYDRFGTSVALSADGRVLVVGASQEGSKGTDVDPPLQDDNSIVSAGAAYVFERGGTGWAQTAYLKASNPKWQTRPPFPAFTNAFGTQLSISGDGSTIAVTAIGEASGSVGVGGSQSQNFYSYEKAGAVYVFRRAGASWTPEAYVKSMETRANARFGDALALSHDGALLVVGEPSPTTDTGATYTYSRQGTTWSFESKTMASNAGEADAFGQALSLSADGTRLLVGAPEEDGSARGLAATDQEQTDNSSAGAGAAYLFRRVGTSWEQQLYIKASNAAKNFGKSVALSGDEQTFVVGSPGETGRAALGGDQDAVLGPATGAAYLFRRHDGAFSQIAYVKSPRPRAGEAFGQRVALDRTGACLAVGVDKENGGARGVNGDTNAADVIGSGAVFLYE